MQRAHLCRSHPAPAAPSCIAAAQPLKTPAHSQLQSPPRELDETTARDEPAALEVGARLGFSYSTLFNAYSTPIQRSIQHPIQHGPFPMFSIQFGGSEDFLAIFITLEWFLIREGSPQILQIVKKT